MTQCTKRIVLSVLLSVCSFLSAGQGAAQEIPAESLRLPEVVITGTEQSKIQRLIPKIPSVQFVLPVVISSSRDDSNTRLQEGNLLSLTQPRQAEKFYVQAITFDPINSQAFLRLGDNYRTLHQYETAAQTYLKALEISENLPEAHYQLGILYEGPLNSPQKAITHYQKYLQGGGMDMRVKIWLKNLDSSQQRSPQAVPPEKTTSKILKLPEKESSPKIEKIIPEKTAPEETAPERNAPEIPWSDILGPSDSPGE